MKTDKDISRYLGKKIKFLARIKSLSTTKSIIYEVINEDDEVLSETVPYVTIQLYFGNQILEALAVCGRAKIELIQNTIEKENQFLITGTLINIPTKDLSLKPMLYLERIVPAKKSLHLIEANKKEIEKAKSIIRKEKSLAKYIKYRLIRITGLKGIQKSPLLNQALDFVIYQALSSEQQGSSSAKLNSLLIGAPGSGKKLISEAISYLNPTFAEVGAGKVTIPGISASTHQADNEWISKPGALVRANRGAIVCQDFHTISKNSFDQIMGILSQVMEDGKVIDSTSSNIEHTAFTAIHLDLNKISDLKEVGEISYHEDIQNIPTNILSRFDFIADIEANNYRQQDIAMRMYAGNGKSLTREKKEEAVRELKVLVAFLKDEYSTIEIPTRTKQHMARLHEELLESSRKQNEIPELGSFQARIVNSVIKLSISSARLNKRSTVKKEDVDNAFRFIQTKFSVIEKIIPNFNSNQDQLTGQKPSSFERRKWIKNNFSGQCVDVKTILAEMQKFFEIEDDSSLKRAIYRDMKSIGRKTKHGLFTIK